jgi:hypothetical protein
VGDGPDRVKLDVIDAEPTRAIGDRTVSPVRRGSVWISNKDGSWRNATSIPRPRRALPADLDTRYATASPTVTANTSDGDQETGAGAVASRRARNSR